MVRTIAEKRDAVAALCRRFGVARLDVFGSAARERDFDSQSSDADFLVEFAPHANDLTDFVELKDALEALFERPVDLVERRALESSRNYIRKRRILAEAEALFAA
jgi:uncharacterized protein